MVISTLAMICMTAEGLLRKPTDLLEQTKHLIL